MDHHYEPTRKCYLAKDEDGNGRNQEWHYRSVIGHKCISLSQSMRNLITFIHIMLEVSSVFGMKCDLYNPYNTTFEDNKGAIDQQKNQNTNLEQKIFP